MNKIKKPKRNNIKSVTAAGGVVYREDFNNLEILLILKNGRWDLPKGVQEENESIRECARREIEEETGIENPVIRDFLVKTRHSYQRNGQLYHKTTYWFRMKVNGDERLIPQIKEGIEQVCWVPVHKSQRKVGYKNLKKVISAFQKVS